MSNKDFNMRAYIDIINESNKQLDEIAAIVPLLAKAREWAKEKFKDDDLDNKKPGRPHEPPRRRRLELDHHTKPHSRGYNR